MSRILVVYADGTGNPHVLGTCNVHESDLPYEEIRSVVYPIRSIYIEDREVNCKVIQVVNKEDADKLPDFLSADKDILLTRFLDINDTDFFWSKVGNATLSLQ